MQLHGKEGGIPDGMITCISNLAAFKGAKGQLREAWELSEMAHRYSRKIDAASGDQVSLTTVNAAIHAATALQHQARLDEAQGVFNRALADLRVSLHVPCLVAYLAKNPLWSAEACLLCVIRPLLWPS